VDVDQEGRDVGLRAVHLVEHKSVSAEREDARRAGVAVQQEVVAQLVVGV
jgi:hypothetical protein